MFCFIHRFRTSFATPLTHSVTNCSQAGKRFTEKHEVGKGATERGREAHAPSGKWEYLKDMEGCNIKQITSPVYFGIWLWVYMERERVSLFLDLQSITNHTAQGGGERVNEGNSGKTFSKQKPPFLAPLRFIQRKYPPNIHYLLYVYIRKFGKLIQ